MDLGYTFQVTSELNEQYLCPSGYHPRYLEEDSDLPGFIGLLLNQSN
jgi:hypothetical protein